MYNNTNHSKIVTSLLTHAIHFRINFFSVRIVDITSERTIMYSYHLWPDFVVVHLGRKINIRRFTLLKYYFALKFECSIWNRHVAWIFIKNTISLIRTCVIFLTNIKIDKKKQQKICSLELRNKSAFEPSSFVIFISKTIWMLLKWNKRNVVAKRWPNCVLLTLSLLD